MVPLQQFIIRYLQLNNFVIIWTIYKLSKKIFHQVPILHIFNIFLIMVITKSKLTLYSSYAAVKILKSFFFITILFLFI